MLVVVKVGTSSVTDEQGALDRGRVAAVADEVAATLAEGHEVVLVTSGAIAAGLPLLGMTAEQRPRDARTLQAVAAVGQVQLMGTYADHLRSAHGIACGQVLLVPHDFFERDQYLHARSTLVRLLELGVLPIVNENDTVADHEIRFGDNDRIAALVAQALQADLLVLLTDTAGLLTADPRLDANASLITDIVEFDREIESMAKGSGSNRGSGGMASKIAAAKMASWAGVRTVIASAARSEVLADAIRLTPGVGTVVHPRQGGMPARKIWIAFSIGASGLITVDDGAKRALLHGGGSLLAAGVQSVSGSFEIGEAVEIAGADGTVFAKGLALVDSATAERDRGRRSVDTEGARSAVVIHRDDLVILEYGATG